jgi:cyclopropane fatty-acyl-phospholipid synthase-like methyltransferase
MKRQPEPELMDSEAQTRAYAEADFDESNSLFTRKFQEYFQEQPAQGALADLGCGPGDISIRMAHQYPGWTVTGLDAGVNMLKLAKQRLLAEGLAERLSFRHSYLPDSSLEHASFDAVISNSLLHHLPQAETLWQSINQLARPGAAIQVMDLMRPESEAEAERLVEKYTPGAPAILTEDFYNSLLAAYTPQEVSDQLLAAGLDRLKIEIASDRHWIVHGLAGSR